VLWLLILRSSRTLCRWVTHNQDARARWMTLGTTTRNDFAWPAVHAIPSCRAKPSGRSAGVAGHAAKAWRSARVFRCSHRNLPTWSAVPVSSAQRHRGRSFLVRGAQGVDCRPCKSLLSECDALPGNRLRQRRGTALAASRGWERLVDSDLHPAGLKCARTRLPREVELVQMDARTIPAVNAFDLTGAFDVVEHIAEE
jgi:hypothetical protein